MHQSEPYPLCVGLDAYAQFGLGIGIYFMQIVGLVVVMVIGGSILIPNMMAFGMNDDWFISFTGACDNEGIISNIFSSSYYSISHTLTKINIAIHLILR